MGIKHFFSWFKKRFASSIYYVNEPLVEMKYPVNIDNLMIDLNGIFHTSAQKIYEYGNFKQKTRLLGKRAQNKGGLNKQIEVYKDICKTIDEILNIVRPQKRIVLCVDGPAPISKQDQQRKRRFMSALERDSNSNSFDSNSITPGTKFMDYLTKYIDWYIKKQISEDKPYWSNIEVIFSNEKTPGEGEHKLINFIRKYCDSTEKFCIFGMDADLIMLTLGTHLPNFYILREEPMSSNFLYYLINISTVRDELSELMKWEDPSGKKKFDKTSSINDFVFMCFTVGNDFLPHIPSIEIIEGSIEKMLDVYKNVCSSYGHLTKNGKFKRKSLKAFLGTVSQYEKSSLEDKLMHREKFFPDELLEKNSTYTEGKYHLDIENYRTQYYEMKISEKNMEKLCHEYLDGMSWVMTYYINGVPSWNWKYPHHYAPFCHTLAQYVSTYKFKKYENSSPTLPFVQLLCVLPISSSKLLPEPLNKLLSKESPLSDFYPEVFDIDLSGKRQTWEGTVLLPSIDYNKIEKYYLENVQKVDQYEIKRNILSKSFQYFKAHKYELKSYYGDFVCNVKTRHIDI